MLGIKVGDWGVATKREGEVLEDYRQL